MQDPSGIPPVSPEQEPVAPPAEPLVNEDLLAPPTAPEGQEGIEPDPQLPEEELPAAPEDDQVPDGGEVDDPDKKPEDEPEATPEGEEAEPVEEFKYDELTTVQKKEFDKLNAEVLAGTQTQAELEKEKTEQGRKLKAAEGIVKEKSDSYQAILQGKKNLFDIEYRKDNAQKAEWDKRAIAFGAEADRLETVLAENGNVSDPAAVAENRRQEEFAKDNALGWQQQANRDQRKYDDELESSVSGHIEAIESSFLEEFTEFKTIQPIFDQFCKDVDASVVKVKTDLPTLHRMYSKCLAAERGSPENMRRIKAGIKNVVLKEEERKRRVVAPDSSSSTKIPPKDQPTKPTGFEGITAGSKASREDPDGANRRKAV